VRRQTVRWWIGICDTHALSAGKEVLVAELELLAAAQAQVL
jgi:hypothetical protein